MGSFFNLAFDCLQARRPDIATVWTLERPLTGILGLVNNVEDTSVIGLPAQMDCEVFLTFLKKRSKYVSRFTATCDLTPV